MTERPDPPPLRTNDVRMVQVGIALWVVALLALLPFRSDLARDGREWWLATCLCGIALGIPGLVVVTRRARRHRE